MIYSKIKFWRRVIVTLTLLLSCITSFSQVRPPINIGYYLVNSMPAGTLKDSVDLVSLNGNGSRLDSFRTVTNLFNENGVDKNGLILQGFPYGLSYAPNAFDKPMFVSKGYFPDYVLLNWELARFQDEVTGYRIYRKLLTDGDSLYTQVSYISKDATSWKDEFAESGVLYEYKILAEGLFIYQQNFLNTLEGVGFRIPSGTVSGRVTYEGGSAVSGVNLFAETNDNFTGSSVFLDGVNSALAITHDADDEIFELENDFTFQAWVRPSVTNGNGTIFSKGNQYLVKQVSGNILFKVGGGSVQVNFPEPVDTFYHISAIRAGDTLRLYVQYNDDTVYKNSTVVSGLSATKNINPIFIGSDSINSSSSFFHGYVDEIRLWNTKLDTVELANSITRIISGTEEGLIGYYRLNESVGTSFFDLSRKGFDFNEAHGSFVGNVQWDEKVPLTKQLSVKGITDENGNYLITGIPYASTGSTYRIVPGYLQHSFDPTERLIFVGPGSNVFSDVNFVDVASFTVRGNIFYRGTQYPVSGAQIRIDGATSVNSQGVPVSSDNFGIFEIDVPIGEHNIQVYKQGHSFENEGYFPSKNGTFNFQQAFEIQTLFVDTTLIKVVGKVVGGPVEAAKPTGLNKTVNNIGISRITLGTQADHKLTTLSNGTSGSWDNSYYNNNDSTESIYGKTDYFIKKNAERNITITPDPTTGEYVAYLLPERYIVEGIIAGDTGAINPKYTYDDSFHGTLDLSSSFPFKTEIDSTSIDIVITPTDTTLLYTYDSMHYNVKKSFIYRVQPSVSMTSMEDTSVHRFWEKEIKEGSVTHSVVSGDNLGDWLTDAPIFIQRNKYKTKIRVFENYINVDDANKVDQVPVVDGTIKIVNNLAIDKAINEYSVDKKGEYDYTFTGGLPNVLAPYTHSMTVRVFTETSGATSYPWPSNGDPFVGYLFGAIPTGSNFVTTGPNEVDMILRDPHGSNSYAYYEVGTSSSTEKSYEVENGESIETETKLLLGAETTTFAGIGAGVIVEAEVVNDVGIGLDQSTNFIDNETEITTTSNTLTWSTSGEPDFVGANGDVFIGHSTNIVYGKSFELEFLTLAESCNGLSGTCVSEDKISGYKIGVSEGVRVSPEFNTGFQFTQNHIENYLIPQLENLRDLFHQAKIVSGEFQWVGTPQVGVNNDLTNITRRNDGVNGDIYNITYPGGAAWPDTLEYVDSVHWYNQQINSWKDILADNEETKLKSKLKQNYSFDAGTILESSTTVEDESTTTSTFEWTINPSIVKNTGGKIAGFGVQNEFKATYNHLETKSTTTGSSTAKTFGYVLNDGDEGDVYSIDVKDPGDGTGPVFAVKGGQSMCPYVDAELTKYYKPLGETLSEATMKRESPQITSDVQIQSGIPQGNDANFNIRLENAAETGDDAWYRLSIDESTISGGTVKLDGAAIKDGRTFFIPAGGSINKLLSISQPNLSGPTTFENVKVVLSSLCQYDPGDNWDDISDTLAVSAYFQAACSQVEITKPDNQWLVNSNSRVMNGTIVESIPLAVQLKNFNTSHPNFDGIAIQYKPVSSSSWITDMVYYLDTTGKEIPKAPIGTATVIDYIFETKSLNDRDYDIRLQSRCTDNTENISDVLSGIRDIKRPKQFGSAQPGDGILDPGDDIMVSFDETIQDGLLGTFNFSVRGVLNGAEVGHNSFLFFDGTDNASIINGIDLDDKSFTIEFWVKKSVDGIEEVVYAQGDLEIGFDATNNFYIKTESNTYKTSTNSFMVSSGWMHWAVSYNHDTKKLNAYLDSDNPIEISNSNEFTPKGRVFIGQSMDSTKKFRGNLHDLRVWEKARGQGSVIANMNIALRGDEVGLSGFWPMNEAYGLIARDEARSHHATLNGAEWRVATENYAKLFNSTDHVAVSSNNFVIDEEMDMTVEFWMKANPQSNTTLFSNGIGDNSDPTPPFENIWVIGTNTNGKLHVSNNGTSIVVPTDVFDNTWHHIAVVLKRIANTSVYVDGNLTVSDESNNFGGFSGAQFSIGMRQKYNAGTYSYDQGFVGGIDDVRFWKLARNKELINLDKNAKLKGDEKGLMAYLPFERYNNNLMIVSDFQSQTLLDTVLATNVGSSLQSSDVPNLKDARPVQKLSHDWVVNDDKVIITINEAPELVEKTIIEITVEDVEDLNENVLASPITWTAYFNQNTMLWSETVKNIETKVGEEVSFSIEIINKGGTEQNYDISNIPSWLEVDDAIGALDPLSSKIINFTIKSSTNIGNYERSIYLGSDFGFKEKLNINLKVSGESPDWEVDASQFTYSMSIVGILEIDGIVSTNPDDKVAAFITENGISTLRGVANLQYVEPYDQYEFFLDVFSDTISNDNIEFKVWNASEGKVHVDVTPSLNFVKNGVIGSPSLPERFKVTNNIIVDYDLNKGWNWISFHLDSPDLKKSRDLLKNLSSAEGNVVKTLGVFDQYSEDYGWIGTISNDEGFNLRTCYKIKVDESTTFSVVGSSVQTDTIVIPLDSGWTWVGYPAASNMSVNDAMGNENFQNGDFIKGQSGFAIYDEYLDWIGSLTFLEPTKGYMIKTNSNDHKTFTYPNPALINSASRPAVRGIAKGVVPWTVATGYSNDMSFIIDLSLCKEGIDAINDYLGVFVGAECRGYIQPQYTNALEKHLFFLSAGSDISTGEKLTFKYYSAASDVVYDVNEEYTFTDNEIVGSLSTPFTFSLSENSLCSSLSTGSMKSTDRVLSVYPNPFDDNVTLSISNPNNDFVKWVISDVSGKEVRVYNNDSDSVNWDGKNLSDVSVGVGVYIVTVYINSQEFRTKIVKTN